MKSFFILTIVVFFVFLNTVSSAKDHTINLKKETFSVSLSAYTVEGIINVSDDEFYIGYKLNAANYQKEAVKLERGIREEFQSLINQVQPASESKKIMLRVNRVFIYEVLLVESKIRAAELNISFIEKHDSSFIELFRSAVSVSIKGNQKEQLVSALEQCFYDFSQRDAIGKLNDNHLPIEDLYKNPINRESQKTFLNTNRSTRGILWTYSDFFYNTPDTTTTFYIERNDRTNRKDSLIIKHALPYYNASLKSKYKIDAWGFADGERIYCKVGTQYYPLITHKGGHYLNFKAKNNTASVSAGVIAGMIGGLFGGLIIGSVVGLIPGVNTSDQLLRLDINTGSFDIFFKPGAKTIESTIVFYVTGVNTPDDKLTLFIDDNLVGKLGIEQWIEFKFPAKFKSILVALKSSDELVYENTIEPSLFYTDVYLCYERKKKPPFFRKATYNTTESILNKLPENKQVEINSSDL